MAETKRPVRRRVIVIDDNETIHGDFRKTLERKDPSSSLSGGGGALLSSAAGLPAGKHDHPAFEVDSALQGQEGLQKVQAALQAGEPYAVAFVDMRMPPGWDGLETVRRIWQCDPDIQVVICTAFSDHSLDQIDGKLGHNDRWLILKKPFDGAEILQLAGTLSEKWRLKREASLKMEELEWMVQERTGEIEQALLHDRLTGLPNRTLLTEQLDNAIERQKRRPEYKFALLFLDLDRFKLINDSLGHEAGDLLLIEIAQRLRELLCGGDLVRHASTTARLGGDEFIVLLEDLHEERDAARVGERMLQTLSAAYAVDGQKVHITASIGIATSESRYARAGDMIRDADTAVHRAKATGRARYVLFNQKMHDEVSTRLAMETALRGAVEQSELTVHYQPIIRLADRRLTGFEAFVRWNHPERGPITAAELIPVAEDTGLILPLGQWVLGEACRQLHIWQGRYSELGELFISVNLSRKQLVDPELVTQISQTIEQAELDPGSLILELTEGSMLDEPTSAVRTFERLQQMGVRLHLDDFGSGCSSLSCLYQFPLSGIKIDRLFIRHVCDREEHAAVLEAIVNIARALNLQVIAEGVETAEQVELLRRLRCDYAQGYFFDKPRDAEGAETFIRQQLSSSLASAGR